MRMTKTTMMRAVHYFGHFVQWRMVDGIVLVDAAEVEQAVGGAVRNIAGQRQQQLPQYD